MGWLGTRRHAGRAWLVLNHEVFAGDRPVQVIQSISYIWTCANCNSPNCDFENSPAIFGWVKRQTNLTNLTSPFRRPAENVSILQLQSSTLAPSDGERAGGEGQIS
jgi:hypothetical protein